MFFTWVGVRRRFGSGFFSGVSIAAFKQGGLALPNRSYYLKEDTESEKIRAEFYSLYEEREAFIQEDRTGFVWLYLKK